MVSSKKTNKPYSILFLGIFISIIGLIAIYDASVVDAYRSFSDKFHYVKQQLNWLILATITSFIVSQLPLRLIKKYTPFILGVSLLLMLLVLIPGLTPKLLGARRWLVIGPVVIQPSEILKISLILYLSTWLDKVQELNKFLVIYLGVMFLIMMQPDLGTGLIITSICFAMFYISGAPLKTITSFLALILGAVLVMIIFSPYRMNRVKSFMDPTNDPLGTSYHINQILYGLGSGGLTGVGLGQSRQKFAYLPEATTDSIFVILAEEIGFIGSAIVILSMIGLALFSFKISLKSNDNYHKLVGSGISVLFISQIFINLGSMTALVPLTGVPLPFISYGGSSLVTSFIALGLLINIAKNHEK